MPDNPVALNDIVLGKKIASLFIGKPYILRHSQNHSEKLRQQSGVNVLGYHETLLE